MSRKYKTKFNVGDIVQDLVLLKRDFDTPKIRGVVRFLCECQICGRVKSVTSTNLSKKVGTTHKACSQNYRKLYPKLYQTWNAFTQRCDNPLNKRYADYGEKGIKHEFPLFINFVDYMLPSYIEFKKNHNDSEISIDRINNSFGYVKGNIRWATPTEQAKNRKTTLKVRAIFLDKTIVFESQKDCSIYLNSSNKTIKKYIKENKPFHGIYLSYV